MTNDEFRETLLRHMEKLRKALTTEEGSWTIKGFIDVYRNIYTISGDTKIVSKVIELVLFPVIAAFAKEEGFQMILSAEQNHYPDMTFKASDGTLFAVDIKSTYKNTPAEANGFTLGCFTGYFRDRSSTKNITYPYGAYSGHFVLGAVYERAAEAADERARYELDKLEQIVSVARNFEFLLQEKWRIATDRPGSGNTKNIGSVTKVAALIEGKGPFASLGVEIFDDYWMNYLTVDMAQKISSPRPYKNLIEYKAWPKRIKPA